MKTQHENRLGFRKNNIVELNNKDLNRVKGGSTEICSKDSGIACLMAYLTF
ncbi:hypothetical protein [Lacinutrix sp. Hel_I_90]|uniref:hypothetical protein n=1 Tax=Lacinutrix sp. Hel_I_90 TaxID=1249999 RepID=UPI000A714618|nr:hypothetical protein [Lacinutrix sp. Hel_I_90]